MSQESPWPFLQGISICVNGDVYLTILLKHGSNFHHAYTDCWCLLTPSLSQGPAISLESCTGHKDPTSATDSLWALGQVRASLGRCPSIYVIECLDFPRRILVKFLHFIHEFLQVYRKNNLLTKKSQISINLEMTFIDYWLLQSHNPILSPYISYC